MNMTKQETKAMHELLRLGGCAKCSFAPCYHNLARWYVKKPQMKIQIYPREADMLCRRHGIHAYSYRQTLEEIATKHGVTRERVRQVVLKAQRKLYWIGKLSEPTKKEKRRMEQ